MKRILAALLLLTLAAPAWGQDFEKGSRAYEQRDYAAALREFRPLAEQGLLYAQYNLGLMYHNGLGVPQDYAEAVRWYRKAADQGQTEAQNALGFMYQNGRGVAQDDAEALRWYRRVADQGYARAQTNLGGMYAEGRGVAQDYAEAVRWYRKAAEQGDERAQTALGHAAGQAAYDAGDYAKALAAWLPLASGGSAEAQLKLGYMHTGGLGVPQDLAEGVKWFRLAAEQGHVIGQFRLGIAYEDSQGVSQDFAEAMKWYRLAAEQGLSGAMFFLGSMYFEGRGVPRDVAEAVKWYRLAAERGNWMAEAELALLKRRMEETGRALTEEPADALAVMDEIFVAIKNANVREQPNIKAARVGRLAKGVSVTVLAKVADAEWYLVARDGERLGYVFAPLLAPEGGAEALAAVAPTRPAAPGNRDAVAVIIGNRAYSGDTPEVDYAYNDADAIKRYVIDVLGYREGNIIDLRDATLGDLRRVFGTKEDPRGQLLNRLRRGRSDVVVFYSGHGVPGLRDKRGYLLPVDGDPNLAENTAYPLDVLQANLADLPARSVQLYLDACFSGNSAGGMLQSATSGIGISARLPRAAGNNFAMLTAAAGDEVASWDREAEMGLFTKNLLEALNGKADREGYGNGDGMVTLSEVKTYLDEEMTFQAASRFDRQQNATMVGDGETVLGSL